MITMRCAHCGGEIQAQPGRDIRLCPYCGKPFAAPKGEPSSLEKRLKAEKDPKKKYRMIQEALAREPDSLEVNKALLYHGRLHEPMRGAGIDFSIIKCHLLSVFDTPEKYSEKQLAEKYGELLRGPQLQRVLSLSQDPDAFFAEYLHRLAQEYVDLFIRGDTRYARLAFGFPRSPESLARACAQPVNRMLREISQTDRLTDAQRALLLSAVRAGYAAVFPGRHDNLDA